MVKDLPAVACPTSPNAVVVKEMFDSSILVVAHFDDEALWFSSILKHVDTVLVCFLDRPSRPEFATSAKSILQQHPVNNLSCLSLDESEPFNLANWNDPVTTNFGLKLVDSDLENTYRNSYTKLEDGLIEVLANYKNVFTHNPWGEYGHEEHVQVFRAVEALQSKCSYDLWFSNYCSNRSFSLATPYFVGVDSDYRTFSTNKWLAAELKNLYQKYNCWTWYPDWIWFEQESFVRFDTKNLHREFSHWFPLNMIRI